MNKTKEAENFVDGIKSSRKRHVSKTMIIGLAVMLGVSIIAGAILVNYLSNTSTAELEVSPPMITGISEGKSGWSGEHFPTADWDYDSTSECKNLPKKSSIFI